MRIRSKQHLFVFLLCLCSAFSTYAQDRDTPRPGEWIHSFLRRNHRVGAAYYNEFIQLNKGKSGKNQTLQLGVYYLLPPLHTASKPTGNTTGKKTPHKEPLFGKKYEQYSVKDLVLNGACFFLVSGHGGPDSGATAKVNGRELHEDEYACDITLRLARNLLEHGATVHIIIQDPKDGIRDGKYLNNSKRETCMGQEIPLNQLSRLKQRSDKINSLSAKSKAKYQRAIFIHLDSRSKHKQLDVFFYYQNATDNKKKSLQLAETMRETFGNLYQKHQPNRSFTGTVTTRNLYVLNQTNTVSIFAELANMQNAFDQRRYVSDDNRQALANWMLQGFIKDYKSSKK